jgi:hypothetical protein
MNKKNKIIVIVLCILALISVVIFGVLCIKHKKNSENNDGIKTVDDIMKETYVPFKLNEAKIVVNDDINVENVYIPKLNIDNSAAESFNEKLKSELYQQEKLKLDYINKNYQDGTTYTLSYKAYTKNNILLISAIGTYSYWPLDGDGKFYYDYAYDLSKNEEISIVDALKALDITDKQIALFTDKCYVPGNGSVDETECTIDLVKTGFETNKWYHIDYQDDMIYGIKYDGVVNY